MRVEAATAPLTTLHPQASEDAKPSLAWSADSLLSGVVAMLLLNVIQRLVGLGRNIGFCRFLTEDQLGLWSLANSLFIIAPPLIVLGLPGAFGKFVEHYRQMGCLRAYSVRMGVVCVVSLAAVIVSMSCSPDWVAQKLYGVPQGASVIAWTAIVLVVLTIHNVVYDMVISLRLVRLASLMQFVSSFSFCVIGVSAIWLTGSWITLLQSYAVACGMAMLLGAYGIATRAGTEFQDVGVTPAVQMWRRVLPFAASMWVTNLLTNSFELSDRYMLLHFSPGGEQAGQGLVGQYYCGRILPNLLYSLALMFTGILLPYLSADWERSRTETKGNTYKDSVDIGQRMRRVFVLMSFGFLALSIGAMLIAPFLFWGLNERYTQALEILPQTLLQTIWGSLSLTAFTYLMCAEKGGQVAALLGVSLACGIGVNSVMIPRWGLQGAVVSAIIANGLLLLGSYWRVHKEGCQLDKKVYFASALPLMLLTGPELALCGCAVLVVIAGRTEWLLSQDDRDEFDRTLLPALRRFGVHTPSLWPMANTLCN
jgi:O-antigen/teichoic acid export membrane protein